MAGVKGTEAAARGALAHLQRLVAIPSVSSMANRPVIAYAAEVLRRAGWATRELPYLDAHGVEKVNLLAAPAGEDVGSTVCALAFFCHTDTVPFAGEWAGATEPRIADGHLHGCGSCDVKGFLACLLGAAERTHSLTVGARIVLTADEEVGCVGASRLLAAHALRPRFAVVGEPTQLRPMRAGKGYCLAEVVVEGRESHSALPEGGASAIYAAAKIVSAIDTFSRELRTRSAIPAASLFTPAYTTLNVGVISGGTAKNVVPGRCHFLVEWRPVPGGDNDEVQGMLHAAILGIGAMCPGTRASLRMLRDQAGFSSDADNRLVARMQSLTGRDAGAIAFGSEASLLRPLTEGAVVFGPGDMGTAHSDRECVPVAELERATEILAELMRTGVEGASQS